MIRSAATFLVVVALCACGRGDAGQMNDLGHVRGTVSLGPMCPVETAASPCPDEPLADVLVEAVSDGGRVEAQDTTDGAGRFELALPEGDYAIRVDLADDPVRSARPVDAHVEPGRTVTISVAVDSGIR